MTIAFVTRDEKTGKYVIDIKYEGGGKESIEIDSLTLELE